VRIDAAADDAAQAEPHVPTHAMTDTELTPSSDGAPSGATAAIGTEDQNKAVDLARIGWLATVVACLIAVVILVLQGYFGYAAVTLAVALSAAINLT
jgi:hypothetical protein